MKKYSAELISFGLLVCGIGLSWGNVAWFQVEIVRFVWYLVAFIPVGFPVLKEAVECLREKEYFNEFMLMSLAAIGAFYIGEYPEGVAVMLFYSIGEKFQDSAVSRARSNIRALLDVRPEQATVIRDGQEKIEKPEQVRVGEIIEIKVGERVPLDGIMLGDVAAFNTAALTGESVPRNIRTGEDVLAGMIVTDRVVRVKVTKPYDQSALARILEMVQNASERKAPAELFIRKFARIYTPVVTGLAVLIVLIPWIVSWVQPDFSFVLNDLRRPACKSFDSSLEFGGFSLHFNGLIAFAFSWGAQQRKTTSSASYDHDFLIISGLNIVIYVPSLSNTITRLRTPIIFATIPTQLSSKYCTTCDSSFVAFSDFTPRKIGSCITSLTIVNLKDSF